MQKRLKATVACLTAKVPVQLKRAICARSHGPKPSHAPTPQPAAAESVESAAKQDSTALEGQFWVAGIPARRRRGELTVQAQADARLDIADLVDMRAASPRRILEDGDVEWTQSGDPEDAVADFSPVTVHGRLDVGRDVTLVDAMGTAMHLDQNFLVRYVLDGAHLDGLNQHFRAVRFQLDDPGWWMDLDDEKTSEAGSLGCLSVVREDRQVWFEFKFSEAVTLRECDSLVLLPARTLANLATMLDFKLGPTQLRVDGEGSPWITVLSKSRAPKPVIYGGSRPPQFLLPTARVLTIERFAQWIEVSAKLDGLPSVLANLPEDISIETKALTMASVAEGLHRRLFEKAKRFQTIKESDQKIARKAAVAFGVLAFQKAGYNDLAEVRSVLNNALGHIADVTYRSRLEDLHKEAVAVVPEITMSFQEPSWAQLVVKTRNLLAHQLDGGKLTTLEKIDSMTLVAWSLPWILRVVLLLRAGIDPAVIRERVVNFSSFRYYEANVAAIQSKYGR